MSMFFDKSSVIEKHYKKPTGDKETTEPYIRIYILLRIMEPKYVYQVAFR